MSRAASRVGIRKHAVRALFSDTFNRSDRALPGDNGWQRSTWTSGGTATGDTTSAITITGNSVVFAARGNAALPYTPSGSGVMAASVSHPLTTPGDVIDFSFDVTHTSGKWGVLFAHAGPGPSANDARGTLLACLNTGASNTLIYDIDQSSNNVSYLGDGPSMDSAGTHTYRIQFIKSTGHVKVYQDGNLVLDGVNTYAGHTGDWISLFSGNATGVAFDNVIQN